MADTYDLIPNNKSGKATRFTWRKMTSTIDLTYMTYNIGVLETSGIDDELAKPSYYEGIVCNQADLEG